MNKTSNCVKPDVGVRSHIIWYNETVRTPSILIGELTLYTAYSVWQIVLFYGFRQLTLYSRQLWYYGSYKVYNPLYTVSWKFEYILESKNFEFRNVSTAVKYYEVHGAGLFRVNVSWSYPFLKGKSVIYCFQRYAR